MPYVDCRTTFAHGVKGYLEQDSDCESPLAHDESVKFVVLHRKYLNPSKDIGATPEEVAEWAEAHAPEWQEFPLFMYDHSGTAYSIAPFSCPWDSGRVGSVFVKIEDCPEPEQTARLMCEEYTSWANGDCWGYVLEDEDGEQLDSCWGFIGTDAAEEAMKEAAAYHVEQEGERQASAAAADIQDSRPDLSPA